MANNVIDISVGTAVILLRAEIKKLKISRLKSSLEVPPKFNANSVIAYVNANVVIC
jgi:hypothetical protein